MTERCKRCESAKLYDGVMRCMKCYAVFTIPQPKKWTMIKGEDSLPRRFNKIVLVAGKKVDGSWDLSIIKVSTMNASWTGCFFREIDGDDIPSDVPDMSTVPIADCSVVVVEQTFPEG